MALSSEVITMPSFDISEKDKDETWHKQVVQALAGDAFRDDYEFGRSVMDINYHYYQNGTNSEQYKYLQEAQDGTPYPARWIHLDRIRTKVNTVLGELSRRGYEIKVEAINEEAKARKLQLRNELRVDMHMKPIADELEQQFGIPLVPGDKKVPETPEELDDIVTNYKEMSETVLEFALRFMAAKYNWDYERLAVLRDILIAGRGFWRVDVVNGVPKPKRVDPRYMVFDRFATDDFLSDSTYFGEVEYLPVAEAAVKYNLTKKQLFEAYKDSKSVRTNTYASNSEDSAFNSLLTNSSVEFFDESGGELRVLVFKAVWQDTKPNRYSAIKDNYGAIHIHEIKGKRKTRGEEITQYIDIWRRATLVAGKFVKDWGEMENRPTSVDSFAETLPPYVACLPNYMDFKTVSIVDQLRGLQDLKDIVWYNLQEEMAASGGKSFIYDISQAPDGWNPEDVVKYLKVARIGFIDSSRNPGTSFNQFGQVDLSLSPAMQQYLTINAAIDAEMNAITGINEARQGLVQGASQAVGVTQSALYQSTLATQTLMDIFEMASTKVLDLSARYIKLLWPEEKERYAPIIGQAGVNFLEQDIELDLQDYAVFIESLPKVFDDESTYQQMLQFGIQSGTIDLIEAFELSLEKNPREGLLKLKRFREKKQREAQQAAQAQQAAEQQHAQQVEQIKRAAAEEVNQGANFRQVAGDSTKKEIALANIKGNMLNAALNNKQNA